MPYRPLMKDYSYIERGTALAGKAITDAVSIYETAKQLKLTKEKAEQIRRERIDEALGEWTDAGGNEREGMTFIAKVYPKVFSNDAEGIAKEVAQWHENDGKLFYPRLDKMKAKFEATAFAKKAEQPISETRQIQAEGPPIQQGPRMGEAPMEQKTTERPMGYGEFQKGFEQLEPEAQKFVPETIGERVKTTEAVYQQPLKTFEEEREKSVKERQNNIKMMGALDKGAGFNTAIIESQKSVDKLKAKKSTLDDLIKTVSKSEGLSSKQIEQGKQNDLELEIDQLAQELNVPQQLAHNDEFLGRMKNEIDRLIGKEEDWQKGWEKAYDEMKKRQEAEARRKREPKPSAQPTKFAAEKELRRAIKELGKQQFPQLFKVIDGEYGIDVLKQTSGIAEAGRAILADPEKRIALGWAFPDEMRETFRITGIPKPPDAEVQAVLDEMQQLQNQVYGVIQGAPTPTSPEEDIFSGLGGLQ